jgi:multiple sugar transport system substrate-binding protein
MKRILVVILAAALLLSLVPVQAQENVTLRISWWGSQTRHDRTLAAIELFESQNPGVKIEPEYMSWGDYWIRMATLMAASQLPDIMQQDLQYIRQYADKGLLEDLMPYVDSGALNLSDVDPAFWTGGMLGDALYGLNLGTNSLMQVYDKVKLTELGLTIPAPGYDWDEYVAFLRELRTKLPDGIYPSADIVTNGIYNLITHRVRQQGGHFYAEDGKSLGFDEELLTWCFQFCKDLTDEALIPPMDVRMEAGVSPEMSLIITNQSVMMETNSNQLISVVKAAGRPLAANIMPVNKEQVANGQYIKPSQFFSVSANSEHKDMAVKFLDFITNSVECNDILLAERGVPISAKIREELKPKLTEVDAIVFDFVDEAAKYADKISPPEPAGHSEVYDLLKTYDQNVCFGEMTPEDAAREFIPKANDILASK